ncbi:Zn-dependent hydrolase [Oscillatoria sp. CS-180]|uniref:Zn-dependent hydrolase n=1 Tax=Oscillatoria sp. CS-180 TaxID=3021720 RepID=UPI00232A9C6A|nr:Zn-dependent hydrolase [Oscillatoria sp. CS-180]MDB9526420.1 Zn-dependent hydrolase [Oscillatoria sp. CS-180]
MVSKVLSSLAVNRDRLSTMIHQLAQLGKLPNGGVQRLAFSPEDCHARALVRRWMVEAGMTVRLDEAGNLIGRYPGRFEAAPPLVTGSHIDTVPNAGHYDGTYGVLAGIESVRTLSERKLYLDHPIEVIVFADEERTMIGCKAMAGRLLNDPKLYSSRSQEPVETCLERVGGDWDIIDHARRTPESMAAFVELHVEQGPMLTTLNKQIGIVTGIVGQRRYWITVEGQSSHAGTTPMSMRQDALVAASQIVLAVNQIGQRPGDQVATVGRLELSPNVPNSIPGKVEMSLDLRDLSSDRLDQLLSDIHQAIDSIAAETDTQISMTQRLHNEPSPANSHIQNAIAQVCDDLKLTHCSLPSRASHDAQEIAHITDMGMIFVPSEGGISHAETEYTSPEDCANGATVLLQTLMRLDRHYHCPS